MLKKQVVKIEWDHNEKCLIACADGSVLESDHVVVTVSLGVLKKNHQDIFSPELPIEKSSVLGKNPFGAVGKIFLQFDEKFWDDDWVGFSLLWNEGDLRELEGTGNAW
jgi:spermine oxidase